MSLPELLHHEKLFVGCLAIRRMKRYEAGETLVAEQTHFPLSKNDAGEIANIAGALFFNPGGSHDLGYDLSIQTQALDYESLNQCPALGEDKRCSIHDDRKPSVCSMVPFDALFPDSLQHVVLTSRNFEENCIVGGYAEGYDVVVDQRQISSGEYRKAVEQRRLDLLWERHRWGDAVFALLRPALFANPNEIQKIPYDGFFTLSIIPLLMVVAEVSEHCRERIAQYVDSQINLIDSKVQQAIQRKNNSDKPTTKELRGFKQAYLKFQSELLTKKQLTTPATEHETRVIAMEKYLGIIPS
jgi:Fe-S-cluster containining protein